MIDHKIQTRSADHGQHLNIYWYEISYDDNTKAKSTIITSHNIEVIGEYNDTSIAKFTQV